MAKRMLTMYGLFEDKEDRLKVQKLLEKEEAVLMQIKAELEHVYKADYARVWQCIKNNAASKTEFLAIKKEFSKLSSEKSYRVKRRSNTRAERYCNVAINGYEDNARIAQRINTYIPSMRQTANALRRGADFQKSTKDKMFEHLLAIERAQYELAGFLFIVDFCKTINQKADNKFQANSAIKENEK